MDVGEPRVRRRGFFLHSTDVTEPEAGEHENPEGFPVRVRTAPPEHPDTSPAAARLAPRAGPTKGVPQSDLGA